MATTEESTSGRAHRAPAGDGDKLRTQLLDAAERLVIEKGSMESVSLRQVAREVGVSATSVYLHFKDKPDLFIGVCSRRFEHLGMLLREARAPHDSPVEQLRASGRTYVRFGLEQPVLYNLLFGAMPMETILDRVPEDELVGMQTLTELAGVVQAGMDSGAFRQGNAGAVTLGLWSVTHGLVGTLHHGHKLDGVSDDDIVDVTMDMVLEGLRPRS